jgi:hypothetical protein
MAVVPPPAVGGSTLTLQIVNHSNDFTNMALYQQDPGLGAPYVLSLGWMVHASGPGSTVTDTWSTDYSFTAANTGTLRPGVTYTPSTSLAVNPNDLNNNAAVLVSGGSGLSIVPGQRPCQSGSLCLTEDGSVGSAPGASVGLGMSGRTAFAMQAQPNSQWQLTPQPTYWVTAGNYQQGEALNTGQISNSAQISFPSGVTNMVATLNPNNTWSVSPGQ